MATIIILKKGKKKKCRKPVFFLPIKIRIDNIEFKSLFLINHKITGGNTMLKMRNSQLARFVVGSPVDAKGDDTTVEAGTLKATSSNEEVFTIAPDEKDPTNPMAFKATGGRKGAAVLTIEADADLGDGVKTIKLEIAVEVESGEAVGFKEPQFNIEEQPEAGAEGGNGGGENTTV